MVKLKLTFIGSLRHQDRRQSPTNRCDREYDGRLRPRLVLDCLDCSQALQMSYRQHENLASRVAVAQPCRWCLIDALQGLIPNTKCL